MPTYIQVTEAEGDEPIEVPCEDDHNNSILLSTLTSLFPGASGLKYRNAETGTIRGIRLIGGRLQPPDEGWGTTSVYCCAFAKDNKRKSKDQSTPPSKRQDLKNKDSSTKKQKLEEERARKKALLEEEKKRKEAQREEERLKREALKEEERVRKEAQKKEESIRKEEERLKKETLIKEERLRKEEERLKEKARKEALKEEERLKKEEERLKEKQKENEKQEKQKNILRNFFIKKNSEESVNRKSITNDETIANGLFLPFELGLNQTRAPLVPESALKRFNRQKLDQLFVSQDSIQLYFELLKSVEYKPLRTIRMSTTQPEIIIESQSDNEENPPKRYRVKHLQFHENVRPPYRGTYRKASRKLKATQPFIKDSDLFDYDADSDEEWEEGGPGESLNGSESDGSVKDDYEIDNEFFVPHGYLSEDENDENDEKTPVDNITNSEDNNQKDIKCGPLLKEQVLMAERNRSFSSNLTPIVLGCVWINDKNSQNNKMLELLQSYKRMSITTK